MKQACDLECLDKSKIYLLCSNTWKPISFLIRFFNTPIRQLLKRKLAKPSHCATLHYDAAFKTWLVVEATGKGFSVTSYSIFCKKVGWHSVMSVAADLKPYMAKYARLLGSKYDYVGVGGNALAALGKWFKIKWLENPWRSQKKFFCSEYAARLLSDASVVHLDPNQTPPVDIWDLQYQLPNKFKVVYDSDSPLCEGLQ